MYWPKAIEDEKEESLTLQTGQIVAVNTLNATQVIYTKELRKEYNDMYYAAKIKTGRQALVLNQAKKIQANLTRYEAITKKTGVPVIMVATIHLMEGSGSFDKHLHNGDPLSARTTHVPKNRPKTGKPPFTWEYSAEDALRGMGFTDIKNWDIPRMLYCLEAYNGFGYRLYHPEVKSPYLWSFTDMYRKGKYIDDGKYDPETVSAQVGCVALMKGFELLTKNSG